jgi:hypothetical protein
MEYEKTHLLNKLKVRDEEKLQEFEKLSNIEPHPLFTVVAGAIEAWEIIDP